MRSIERTRCGKETNLSRHSDLPEKARTAPFASVGRTSVKVDTPKEPSLRSTVEIRCLPARSAIELVENVRNMTFHRMQTERKIACNMFITRAGGDLSQHF